MVRRLLLANLDMCELNAAVSRRSWEGGTEGGVVVTASDDAQYHSLAALLASLRMQACDIQEAVAAERQKRLNGVYIQSLLSGTCEELKEICVTCTLVKPTRVHHCAECAHCLL